MNREQLEKRLISIANIIGTDYGPYREWLKKDLRDVIRNLKIRYKAELLAHIKLHSRKDAYAAAEQAFYGGGVREVGSITKGRQWQK